jgi:ribose/xylose/arabinose/galactoside ABC-type transport system permease subunit
MNESLKSPTNRRKISINDMAILLVVLAVLVIVFAFISPNFFTYMNLSRMLNNMVIMGIIAIALTPVIISRGLDLSFGSSISLATVVMAVLYRGGNIDLVFVLIIGFFVPAVVGIVNGLLIEIFDLNPLILTLGMGAILHALAMVVAGGGRSIAMMTDPLYFFARRGFLGIPYPVIVLIAVLLVFWFILAFTKLGRKIYLIGSNPVVAKLSGIKVKQIKVLLYFLMGVVTGIAGIVMVSVSGTGYPYHGDNIILPVLSALFLGGISLAGGSGSVFKTILGAIIITVIMNGLSLLNVQFYFIKIYQGLALILIVALYEIRRSRVIE